MDLLWWQMDAILKSRFMEATITIYKRFFKLEYKTQIRMKLDEKWRHLWMSPYFRRPKPLVHQDFSFIENLKSWKIISSRTFYVTICFSFMQWNILKYRFHKLTKGTGESSWFCYTFLALNWWLMGLLNLDFDMLHCHEFNFFTNFNTEIFYRSNSIFQKHKWPSYCKNLSKFSM